jgi:hypothetical protein
MEFSTLVLGEEGCMKAKLDLRAPLLAAIFLVSVIGLIIAGFPLRSGHRNGRVA